MVERTVNLLNNNKIIIKSVKCMNPSNALPATTKIDTSAKNEKPNSNSMSQRCETNESKTHSDRVKMSDATERKSLAPKIKREFEQLQKTVNESKVLTEFIIDRYPRGRRSVKTTLKRSEQIAVQQQANEMDTEKIEQSDRSPNRSRSNSPATKESDKLVVGASSKRYTRSRNSDFSAKQKSFIKGILEVTRGSDDESEHSVGEDDEADVDFYVAAAKPPERNGVPIEQSKSNGMGTHEVIASIKMP